MAALAGGLAALILGVIGVVIWWSHFLSLLMGGVPIMLILGGALAAYLGFEELKDKKSSEKFDDSKNLKDEVDALRKEIKDLKINKEGQEKSE
ncbi:MAG: hypothetical protein COX16_10420 [Deltaproteobacteria bacterium CG23_combo_of_CG06-09_8_20_14_all_51_20]|nr:hypothetical protein [bacterium]OIP38375.1 MAG: hypothetical protein AUK25_12800 [Desulfobacteraceae bacterium CG2_30_51_40]PIP46038.1 MAG: hypothetical protein COX16_10420 [Deltaproteobacteria bacterium CG23_combo_of_CG06-09_8_20_14_all_51_20]PIY22476.1 MAG: hypothetical protein COZ11_12550 [Deltaproteobacteria bacterium CG_4_10_14_3_um_filter_51_14]